MRIKNLNLKPCPFCGSDAELCQIPLWNGSHGYPGCYEYVVHCSNPECESTVKQLQNDTVYRSDQEVIDNAVNAWNKRA